MAGLITLTAEEARALSSLLDRASDRLATYEEQTHQDRRLAEEIREAAGDLVNRISGAGSTAYSRLVPTARTVANPLSRSTRRCWETAGWLIPNSAWMTVTIWPDECSSPSSSSRIRRRTGSPRTSKACTPPCISGWTYIRPDLHTVMVSQ